ncbi:class I SAM-dependent methyltransferase [Sphingobacterium sp. UT-1RO-CII-1]|uniref:O-methyltransferase n=1 Tax=Sphingobacterium sp. UT-1RO-CII-1 TaxID=2995225 RepID=UPI00227A8890|nr:class I SAM-dependent methyltransferase [Sphingobacterium sp. UT-1RO-CII-1]MCY4780515.1 class I SAM-dependent methyltransferase [Sphingobacterium sp. UT-1RO-CII-1]
MNDSQIKGIPNVYNRILDETMKRGFTMPSDLKTCSLLRTLAMSKPNGSFLELGTGTGLSTSWILDGMDDSSRLISIDNAVDFQNIAVKYLSSDKRLTLLNIDGEDWIRANSSMNFDFIFADTWPGKYNLLKETISMLNKGGIYLIDDMSEQPNWPLDHDKKVLTLIDELEAIEGAVLTKQEWSTGIIILVKK